ncbi:MAG: hypothetical protein SGJ24_20055 [Chloroflexota bacterium]|nr:hypothetical protein [Chloroflexota bacterium]
MTVIRGVRSASLALPSLMRTGRDAFMRTHYYASLLAIVLLTCLVIPAQAQDTAPVIDVTLAMRAGFATFYRDSDWLPVTIEVSNQGDALIGSLVIRPQTTSGALHTVTTPVTLAAGARQTITLYTTLRAGASAVRVELLNESEEAVITSVEAPVRAISAGDVLIAVLTTSPVGSIDLTSANTGGRIHQANLAIRDLPDRLAALDSLDVIALSDVDTGTLSAGQRAVLTAWVASGGHLLVTGGASAQATAAGVVDLLPLSPRAIETTPDLSALDAWLRGGVSDADGALVADTAIAVGALHPDARVLASTDAGIPLIARRAYGDGVVDLLTVDPNGAPLRGWSGLSAIWSALLTTVEPLPPWGTGFVRWDDAGQAASIIPGAEPLPDVLPLFGFLLLYIALVGPINYIVLARLNRREWAWVTIPVLILIFSALAYGVGSGLRGSEVTVTRLTVVRAWHDADTARVDGAFGLLSPKRASYSFGLDAPTLIGATLRPLPSVQTATRLLSRAAGANIAVEQRAAFKAVDFTIDSSFVAGFNLAGALPKPAIGGSVTLTTASGDADVPGQGSARGFVRNDSDLTLTEAVILMRGATVILEQPLTPDASIDFDLILPGTGLASAGRYTLAGGSPSMSIRRDLTRGRQTLIDIMTPSGYDPNLGFRFRGGTTTADLERIRRQWLLSGVISDGFGGSGRGDRAYLVGWSAVSPVDTALDGAAWMANDRALYVIELDVSVEAVTGDQTITPDRFTWSRAASNAVGGVSPLDIRLSPGEDAALRFTPLPDAVLRRVDSLMIEVGSVNFNARSFPAAMWNWGTGAWDAVELVNGSLIMRDPDAYLGASNAVLLRFSADEGTGYLTLNEITLSMRGRM